MKITKQVGEILDACKIEGNVLFLPEIELPRDLYLATNKILTALGGKWNRKAGGHLFDSDPTEAFDATVQAGEVIDPKKFFQFFETPKPVVDRMIELAELKNSDMVLEPSAGKGAIAYALKPLVKTVVCYDINPEMVKVLSNDFLPLCADFLEMELVPDCDAIVMNPPFSKFQDIDHVLKAFECLKPEGRLVAVMSEGTFFRTTKKALKFRKWLDEVGAHIEKVPDKAFKSSGTLVNTRIVMIRK